MLLKMWKEIQKAVEESKPKSPRMFKNDLLESLSHVHPIVPLVIYLPVVIGFYAYSIFELSLPAGVILLSFPIGLFLWSLTEYVVHRFIFHPPLKNALLQKFYFYVHGVHHDAPKDATRLVMPPAASIPLAFFFYFLFQNLFGLYAYPLFGGFVLGYLIYDYIHFTTHFFNFRWKWFQYLKKHHYLHHFKDEHKNYGVSSPLWDFVFSTYLRQKEKKS